jgi:hypothetical protein
MLEQTIPVTVTGIMGPEQWIILQNYIPVAMYSDARNWNVRVLAGYPSQPTALGVTPPLGYTGTFEVRWRGNEARMAGGWQRFSGTFNL